MQVKHVPLVHTDGLLGFREAAAELGIDLEPELKKLGIPPCFLAESSGYLPVKDLIKLVNALACKSNCPQLGLLIAEHRPKTRFGLLTQLIKVCPDVGTALRKGHAHIKTWSENTIWQIDVEDGFAMIARSDRYLFSCDMTQLHLLSIAQYFELLVALLGDTWRPSAVFFTHRAPEDIRRYKKVFQCPLHFEQSFDGFTFPSSHLDTPIPTYDPLLLRLIEQHIESFEHELGNEDICSLTRRVIRQMIGTRACTLGNTAQHLGKHPKALQRSLQSNGTSFKQLLAEERKDISQHYLRDSDLPLHQISAILGYSSPSAFSRAFTQQHGVSPIIWRTMQ